MHQKVGCRVEFHFHGTQQEKGSAEKGAGGAGSATVSNGRPCRKKMKPMRGRTVKRSKGSKGSKCVGVTTPRERESVEIRKSRQILAWVAEGFGLAVVLVAVLV